MRRLPGICLLLALSIFLTSIQCSPLSTMSVKALRGGGIGKGTKRSRGNPEPVAEGHEEGGNVASFQDDRTPPIKAPRRSWWNLSWRGGRKDGDSGNLVKDMLQSALHRARGLFSWSRASSSIFATRKSKASQSRGLVFKDDHDQPTAVRRQIEFYFSDSNLPSGTTVTIPLSRRTKNC